MCVTDVLLVTCSHLSVELCLSYLKMLALLIMSTGEVQPLSLELPLESEDRRVSFLQKRVGKTKKRGLWQMQQVTNDKCRKRRRKAITLVDRQYRHETFGLHVKCSRTFWEHSSQPLRWTSTQESELPPEFSEERKNRKNSILYKTRQLEEAPGG